MARKTHKDETDMSFPDWKLLLEEEVVGRRRAFFLLCQWASVITLGRQGRRDALSEATLVVTFLVRSAGMTVLERGAAGDKSELAKALGAGEGGAEAIDLRSRKVVKRGEEGGRGSGWWKKERGRAGEMGFYPVFRWLDLSLGRESDAKKASKQINGSLFPS